MSDVVNCPRCNSEEGFKPRFRADGARPWLIVYVKCSMCRWEKILRKTTQEIEDTRARILVIKERKAREEFMHGQCSQSMLNILTRAEELLARTEAALRKEVVRYGSSDD